MADNSEASGVSQRVEEFLQVFKKGAEFTQELLKENERLRYHTLELEQQLHSEEPVSELKHLRDCLNKSETEKNEILARVSSIEQENLDYANRYTEIESENNLLANLYITTFQLHSTFNVSEIVRIIEEVLLNLVGAEQFALLLRENGGQMLQPLISEAGESRILEVGVNDPRVELALQNGQLWIASPVELARLGQTEAKAVIPLKVDDEMIGVLAVYQLLDQKNGFTEIDEEIFTLLGTHAAMALCAAILMRENVGEINFRQGFLSQS